MKSDMAFLAQMEREIIERDAAVQGNSASIVTESRIKGRYKERDIDLVSTETAVLERDADAWKIVHLHWSSRAPESHQSLYERSPDANLAILPASVYGHRRCFAAGL